MALFALSQGMNWDDSQTECRLWLDAALPSAGTMTTISAYFRLIRLASEDDADRWVRKSASVADFLTAQVVGEARRDVSNA